MPFDRLKSLSMRARCSQGPVKDNTQSLSWSEFSAYYSQLVGYRECCQQKAEGRVKLRTKSLV